MERLYQYLTLKMMKLYDESYWFEDDNPETAAYDSSYPINSLYRQIIFQLPIPKNGKIVVVAGNGKTLDHLIEKFGEDRVIGYDLFNPTNHPNIEIFDCNDLDRVGIHNFDIALLHNDLVVGNEHHYLENVVICIKVKWFLVGG